MPVQLIVPGMAMTLIAAAVLAIVVFGLTDWWEILGLALAITVSIYFIMRA